MIRRNAATVKYLALWGMDIVSNIIPIHASVDESCRVDKRKGKKSFFKKKFLLI